MSLEEIIQTTPFGRIRIQLSDQKLLRLQLNASSSKATKPDNTIDRATKAAQNITAQLEAYFKDPCYRFAIERQEQGTEFQRKIWQALIAIPVGQTMTYGQLAKQVNSGARAVANACRNNPTPIIVPCHRIVAANGIGGFAGKTSGSLVDIKQALLKHEGVIH